MLDSEKHWLRSARQLRTKINFAIWLDRAALPGVIAAGISAAAILLVRHHWPQITEAWQLLMAIAPTLLALLITWFRARSTFIPLQQAMVRLECRHGLHAALSTAHEGAGQWPAPAKKLGDGLRWSWWRTSIPTCLMLALVTTSWFLPVEAPANGTSFTEPATWKLVENNLERMVKNELVDKSSAEAAQKAIDALRQRPQGEWFDHSSIEAGDRILSTQQRDMSELEGRLRETARALRNLADARKGIQAGGPQPDAAFNDLMSELKMGGLTPDKELLEKLSEMQGDGDNPLNQIDPRQLADLLDQIEGNAQQLSEMLEQMNGAQGEGEQPGAEGEGEPGGQDQPGQGKPQRGPGQGGPLEGDPNENELDPANPTPLAAGDTSRSLPGDYLGEGQAKHNVDPNDSPALRAGGGATQPGDGGSAVWQESLHPREQEALRRFFE